MFSPLSVVIKPSRIKRWLYASAHLLVILCISLSQLGFIFKLAIIFFVGVSLVYEWLINEKKIFLVWDLDQYKIVISFANGPLQQCLSIAKLNVLFGIIYLHIKISAKPDLHLYIFPDSVDQQSYRKLRVAARWATIKINSDIR